MNNQKMSVNIVPGISAPSALHASEGDVGRTCEIIIIDGTSAYKIPSTATVTITATKPSGMGFTQTCTVTENGTATFETTASMTDESGKMQAEVRIVDGGQNIGTANLLWIVERNPHPSNVIDGDVEQAKTILERAEEAMTKAEEMIEKVDVYNSIVEEVEDARKGFDGVTYGTLGEAVRGQADNLQDSLDMLGLSRLNLKFNPGFIKYDTLQYGAGGTHQYSDNVMIPAMSLVYVPRISRSGSTSLLTLCDSEGTPTQCLIRGTMTSQSTGDYIIYPFIESAYVRFGGNTAMAEFMKYYVKKFDADYVVTNDTFGKLNPALTLEYAAGSITADGVQSGGTSYKYTANMILPKGMTIEAYSAGYSTMAALSEFGLDFKIKSVLLKGNTEVQHFKYTADKHMLVRLSARVQPVEDAFTVVLPEEKLMSWKIYNETLHYKSVEDSPLYGQKITAIGDSLIHGNALGPGATWVTNIGLKYNMEYVNMGVNGNTVAVQATETESKPMVERVSGAASDTDIFVLLGGANDKRLGVPIGEVDGTDTGTFCGALNSIIDTVRSIAPKVKMMFMTTYNRYASYNNLGFTDIDYAEAMISVCRRRKVPCFDNYHNSGADFLNDIMRTWMDESRNRSKLVNGVTTYIEDTHHFSLEGYEWLTPVYESLLTTMSCDADEPRLDYELLGFINELLEVNSASAVTLTGANNYVTPNGKYVIVNGTVYFKCLFYNKNAVNTGTGGTAVANLPAPADVPVFFETNKTRFESGGRLTYETVWRLYGKRTKGDYTLVFGAYTPAA